MASLALAIENKTMPSRQLSAVSDFYEILTDIRKTAEDKKLPALIKYIIKKTKYEDYLKEFSLAKQSDYENFEDRMENLKELLTVASKFESLPNKEGVEKFLEEVTLLQQNDRIKSSSKDGAGPPSQNASEWAGKKTERIIRREVLTKQWTDWVDYWAVDFDFGSRKEMVRIEKQNSPSASSGQTSYEEVWTGGYIFENEWQSFRTKKDKKLELVTSEREVASGKYKIAVKVVDIFGNDTTKVIEVKV